MHRYRFVLHRPLQLLPVLFGVSVVTFLLIHAIPGDPVRTIIGDEIQRIAKDDVHWIDLYYSPFRNISRANVQDFFQNPLGRFMLETTSIAQ